MKTYVPEYYFNFQCIASRCKHTCCAGWEIDLDEDTLCIYAGVSGSLGQELKQYITREEDGSAHFILQGTDERCPFLREDGLCRLILELGQESLSQICTDHPRFRNYVGAREEMGLGLCCEAAAELILSWEKPFRLMQLDGESEQDACCAKYDDPFYSEVHEPFPEESLTDEEISLLHWRQRLFSFIQQEGLPFSEKLHRLLPPSRYSLLTPMGFAPFYENMEYMDEDWRTLMQHMGETQPIPFPEEGTLHTMLQNLLIYFLYRHMSPALEDGNREARLIFCLTSLAVVWHAACALAVKAGSPTPEEFADAARRYSSEVEYSDENIATFLESL